VGHGFGRSEYERYERGRTERPREREREKEINMNLEVFALTVIFLHKSNIVWGHEGTALLIPHLKEESEFLYCSNCT
jgi:hypothetical protein